MTHREGPVTYEDALTGRFNGEFWQLARCDLIADRRFDERASGAESSVWWPLLKISDGWLIGADVRTYDSSGSDRVSHIQYTRRDAAGRMWACHAALVAVGEDLRTRYPAQYGGRQAELAKWAAMAGEGAIARRASREALRYAPSRRSVSMAVLCFAPSALLTVAAERERLELPAAGPTFVVIGELNANKRQADAIAALAAMDHRDAQLVFLGVGRERLPLETLARERGLADRVHFGGLVEDVRPTLLGSTSLITTSKREGLSRSVMEALALEIPVVASSARGNEELVGEDGFVVETGDARALAGAMDWLIEHPAEQRAFGRRGRQRMVDRYDLSHLIVRHEALYAGMLAERG